MSSSLLAILFERRILACTLLIASLFFARTPVAEAGAIPLAGNEFALYYSEASTDAEREAVLKQAGKRSLLFRYLQIIEMEETTDGRGRSKIEITAFEPSSLMDVLFVVTQPVSLSILREEPASRPGDAIAVRGRVAGIDHEANTIRLNPVIVRHKDRLSPAAGKEMLYEIKPDGVFYAFTEGPRPIHLNYRDRDLLRHREKILKGQGAQAWFEFLERELAERRNARNKGDKAPR